MKQCEHTHTSPHEKYKIHEFLNRSWIYQLQKLKLEAEQTKEWFEISFGRLIIELAKEDL